MALFATLGIPLFCLFVFLLLRVAGSPLLTDEGEAVFSFLRGLLLALPAILLMAILNGLYGVSHRPLRLFLFAFFRFHFLPALLALAGFVLVGRREVDFLKVAAYLLGFFALYTVGELLGSVGRQDGHDLFLLPLVRIASAILAAELCTLAMEEFGKRQVLLLILLPAVPLSGAAISWLALAQRPAAATLGAAALFLGALVLLAWKGEIRPEALKG